MLTPLSAAGSRGAPSLVPGSSPGRFLKELKSPLPDVPIAAWERLVAALEVQPMGAISERGGFGSYDLRPPRLVDLGILTATRRRGAPPAYAFAPPHTRERFLADPRAQLAALCRSLRGYHDDLVQGRRTRPAGMSLAGALALLHCGPGALVAYPVLFPHTRELYERAEGAF